MKFYVYFLYPSKTTSKTIMTERKEADKVTIATHFILPQIVSYSVNIFVA